MNKKQNDDWKKDLKDTLEILAWAAISAGIVFQTHSSCTRRMHPTEPNGPGTTIATESDTAAREFQHARTVILHAANDTITRNR